MNPFVLSQAADAAAAVEALRGYGVDPVAHARRTRCIAGGTNLVDLVKQGVEVPARLVDINHIGLDAITRDADGALSLGALARNADTAHHPLVRAHLPLLASAILSAASPQIRNAASNGGNLLQRTRCLYFQDTAMPCNKREPGSGCAAIGGLTRQHAILGASSACIATHPSDMCVALAALDAQVHVRGPAGAREIAFEDFHRLPGDMPHIDTTLQADELITAIVVPANDLAAHSVYLKIRDRASYAFALVSVAAALQLAGDGTIADVRVAIGSVAHKPWRRRDAEALLVSAQPTMESFTAFADALLDGAIGQGDNDFKIPLARRSVIRALQLALLGTVVNPNDIGDDAGCSGGPDRADADSANAGGTP